MRNIEKAIQEGEKIIEKRRGLDITVAELEGLLKGLDIQKSSELYEVATRAYYAGLKVGYGASK